MSEEPFVMLSLKGDKTKKLANALTNKSADKILAHLATKKTATESEIAKALKLPVSTVNYTMKVLVDAKLVTADEYTYSKKGREVNQYKLAKKYIIIAPDDDEGFFERLKKYVPALGITVGIAAVIRFFQEITRPATNLSGEVMQESARIAPMAEPMAADVASGVAPAVEADGEAMRMMVDESINDTAATEIITQTIPEPTIIQNTPIDWFPYFLLGAFVLATIILLFEHWRKR